MVPSLSPPLCSRPAPFAPPPLTATPPPSPPPTTSPSPELAIETLSISRDPPPTPLTRCHEINFQIIWSVDSGPGSANPDEVCPAGWKPGEKSMKPNHNKNIYFALRLTRCTFGTPNLVKDLNMKPRHGSKPEKVVGRGKKEVYSRLCRHTFFDGGTKDQGGRNMMLQQLGGVNEIGFYKLCKVH
ncbi:uncharacterized protein LOC109845614 isoform X1 [Asparagus officinalis]|uniref:uncharacterized protein LOC109845614 isoform X1 n=1 Tax=Asparagus officinalis TaxID=4686 RepID=UPI00098E291C|nr:uncharacterized protein LOC109845614 isoform X1 [Asparagus officinalis]